MSLPPSFLDDLRQRLTLSDVIGRKVIWDQRKSNAAKGDFWSPCPFHQEKTPSFHVDDRKGFYYCFGCHQKGDMITFVKETDNVSFMEAVEILAREAGMEMPRQERDPHAAEKRDRASRLVEVMEEAVKLYGLAFRSNAGTGARDYASRRGLDADTLKRFEIGYAPDARTHQTNTFRDKGVLDEAIAAGLVIKPDDGGAPYDRFRGRLMFPIRDPRGRCIAFGGRALSAEARAKYLNSPETELFHKGRVLFNQAPAREAAGKSGELIVAEGYMDVIALAKAGFDHAVAPLGTAITEEQLKLFWRIAPEPIIALDGDSAGLRAAGRLLDLALPMLAPGQSLRFCLLPEGQDPDDLIKTEGREAMRGAIDSAIPLIEMLWRREVGQETLDTPERRAGFDERLRKALGRIGDRTVRDHYGADIRERRRLLFQTRKKSLGGGQRTERPGRPDAGSFRGNMRRAPASATPETVKSDLARKQADGRLQAARIREATILLVALSSPKALAVTEAALEEMEFTIPEYSTLRDHILSTLTMRGDFLKNLERRVGYDPVTFLQRVPQARAHPHAKPEEADGLASAVLREAIERHQAELAYEVELSEAKRDLADAEGEDWTWRLRQAKADLQRQTSVAEAQSEVKQETRPSAIQEMLDNEVYIVKKRRQTLSKE